jgi:thymidine phosphorylase
MNEPLASAAGNAVEVRNAVDFLTGGTLSAAYTIGERATEKAPPVLERIGPEATRLP